MKADTLAKLGEYLGMKADSKETAADWSEEKQATKYFEYLREHGFGDDLIIPKLTERFPAVDIEEIARTLPKGSDVRFRGS